MIYKDGSLTQAILNLRKYEFMRRGKYRFSSQQGKDAQSLILDEAVSLELVPVHQLHGKQLPDRLATHQLG